jgi:small-conductance mechanosensitive channel/CRP-like cAMP-binding protein
MMPRVAGRTRSYELLLWLLGLAALLVLLYFKDPLLSALGLKLDGVTARNSTLVVMTAAWLVGALAVGALVDLFIWDFLMARALGGRVPGVLKALGGIVIFLIAAICIVGLVFERSVTGFLAGLGAAGFALGLALRHLFADVFTGLAINLDRTFLIGDWIEVDADSGSTVGRIEEIGWRSTHLQTEDQTTVVIPNSYLGINRITNISRPALTTRFQTKITLDFSVPVNRAKRVLEASLQSVSDRPGFCHEKVPEVLAGEMTERGLDYVLRYWIVPWTGISPNRARDVVTTSAMDHLRAAGITPAYEKADVFHRDMPTRNWEGHSHGDRVELLSRMNLFSMLEIEEIEKIADSIERRDYANGEALFKQGDTGDSLFILTEGLLDVTVVLNGSGPSQRVARIPAGEFVGEMSLLTGEPRSATVSAATASVVYEIKGQTVHDLLERRPQIATKISRVIAERNLRNEETRIRLSESSSEDHLHSLASQLLSKMMSFLSRRRRL